jgi:DMSO/TMAO reductase YedYZ molybdopterin-dependent catalytic subunit
MAFCNGGYTTNLPIEDVTGGKAWVAYSYDGGPFDPEHGGPARLLVPHLYFRKSAKWVRGIDLRDVNEPGFLEIYGYRPPCAGGHHRTGMAAARTSRGGIRRDFTGPGKRPDASRPIPPGFTGDEARTGCN